MYIYIVPTRYITSRMYIYIYIYIYIYTYIHMYYTAFAQLHHIKIKIPKQKDN